MGIPTALIFRGQPVQYQGIGSDIYNSSQCAKNTFETVRETGRSYDDQDVLRICFGSDITAETLKNVLLAHAAIFSTNHALYQSLKRRLPDLEFAATAGHSLGQVNAFVAAGALSFEDAANLVLGGGKYLHEASADDRFKGNLAAVRFNADANFEEVINKLKQYGVYIALDNAPGSIVIGGLKTMVNEALGYLRSQRIRAGIIEKIEGPFHTPYLKGAPDRDNVTNLINSTAFNNTDIPVYANTTSQTISSSNQFCAESDEQMFMTVKWRELTQRMGQQGIGRFIVIDPEPDDKQTIAKTINIPNAEILVVKDMETLDGVVERLAVPA